MDRLGRLAGQPYHVTADVPYTEDWHAWQHRVLALCVEYLRKQHAGERFLPEQKG